MKRLLLTFWNARKETPRGYFLPAIVLWGFCRRAAARFLSEAS